MKAYVIFSSSEPVLVLARRTIRSEAVLKELRRIGCQKFIAREVPVDHLRNLYGRQFEVIEASIQKGCDLRVLDYSGRRIFRYLPFSDFGPAYRREPQPGAAEPLRDSSHDAVRRKPSAATHTLFG